MKFSDSFGLLVTGAVMFFLPRLAPSMVMGDALSIGMSPRALWLLVMGVIIGSTGGIYVMKHMAVRGARVAMDIRQQVSEAREARAAALAEKARHRGFAERATIRVANQY